MARHKKRKKRVCWVGVCFQVGLVSSTGREDKTSERGTMKEFEAIRSLWRRCDEDTLYSAAMFFADVGVILGEIEQNAAEVYKWRKR